MIKNNLARMLGERKWTQADLARKTGIRPNTINAIYNEYIERVSLKQLDKICATLDCTLSEFWKYIPQSAKSNKIDTENLLSCRQLIAKCPYCEEIVKVTIESF